MDLNTFLFVVFSVTELLLVLQARSAAAAKKPRYVVYLRFSSFSFALPFYVNYFLHFYIHISVLFDIAFALSLVVFYKLS